MLATSRRIQYFNRDAGMRLEKHNQGMARKPEAKRKEKEDLRALALEMIAYIEIMKQMDA